MALPKLNVINHNLNLPSTGKELTYRPFLVKEEKMLMMAMESGEPKDMIRATRDIITSCVEDNIDVNNLPMFDIEYIFLQLRAKSIGDITTIMLWIGGQVSTLNIITSIIIPSTVCILVPLIIISFTLKGDVVLVE